MLPRSLLAAMALAFGLSTGTVQAVTMVDFDTEVLFGPLAGVTGVGTLTYDETLLTGVGDEFLDPSNDPVFAVVLTMFGQVFTAADDVDFPAFPSADFFDGVWIGLDFIVEEALLGPDNPTDIDLPGLLGFSMFDVDLSGQRPLLFVFTIIPEPATLGLLGVALLGLAGARRRRR